MQLVPVLSLLQVAAILALKIQNPPVCTGTIVTSNAYGCDTEPGKSDCAKHISCPGEICFQCGISQNGQCLHTSVCQRASVAILRDDCLAVSFAAGARADYNSPSGLGRWTFVVSNRHTPGAGTETILQYSTKANGVRAANAFVTPNSKNSFDLPGIGTKNGVLITPENHEGKADDKSLALHPGSHGDHRFLLVKFTAAAAVDVTGYVKELGNCGSIDAWIFAGTTQKSHKDSLSNRGSFTLTKTTLAAGSTLTVAIGPNGGWGCDHSSLSLTIEKA